MSPARLYDDPDEQAAYLARSRQSWDRIYAARQQVTAADAQAVSTMAANYPHMSPGTVLPLAQAKVAPDDPLAQHVATEEAKSNKRKRGFWGAVGDHVGDAFGAPLGALGFGVEHVLNPIGGAALTVAKPVLRQTLGAASGAIEVGTGLVRDVAAVGGDIAAGVASGAAVGGALGVAGGPFAPISVAAGAIGGAVVGGVTGALAEAKGVKIESKAVENPFTQSAFFQQFSGKSLGSGYMPGGEAHDAAARAQQRTAAINGHALTPGRFLATAVTEPGTTPYNLLSGLMDTAVSWELDPAQHALKGVGRWRKAEASFVPTEKALARIARAGRGTRAVEGAVIAEPDIVTRTLAEVNPGDRIRLPGQKRFKTVDAFVDFADEAGPAGQQLTQDELQLMSEQRRLFVKWDDGNLSNHWPAAEPVEVQSAAAAARAAPVEGRLREFDDAIAAAKREINDLTAEAGAGLPMSHPDVAAAQSRLGELTAQRNTLFDEEGNLVSSLPISPDAERVEAGLVDSTRKTVIGERVSNWLTSEKGQKAAQWFADHDFEDIRQALGKNKVPIEIVQDLHNAKTPEEVLPILQQHLGLTRGMELKPKVGGLGMEMKRVATEGVKKLPGGERVVESRLWGDLPSGELDYNNPTEATDQFNLLLRDANVPKDIAAGHTQEFANLMLDGSYEARRSADALAYRAFGGTQGKIAQSVGGQKMMRSLAKRAADGDADVLRSLIDEDMLNAPSTLVSIAGEAHGLPDAGTLASLIDDKFMIDRNTIREIRAVTSRHARLMTSKTVRVGASAADGFTNDLWKPAALLRGAWTVRVVGEEQIRMAAAGRLSLFNHPMSYLAWAMDEDSKIATILRKHGVDWAGKGQVAVTGERFAKEGTTIRSANDELERELMDAGIDHFAEALPTGQQAAGFQDKQFTNAKHTERYTKGMPGHVEASAEKIDQLASDPVITQLATRPYNEVRRWFISGDGNEIRQAMIKRGAPLRSDAQVDAHLVKAKKQLDNLLGTVEGPGVMTGIGGPSAVGGGPQFEAAYGRHPGIEARAPAPTRPEIAPLELPERPAPLSTSAYRPPRSEYRVPGPTAAPDPRLARNAEEKAAFEAEAARLRATRQGEVSATGAAHEAQMTQRQRIEEMNARYQAQRAGGAAPSGPSYGNASQPQFRPIEGPQQAVTAKAGSATLREAIATGELNGVAIRDAQGKLNPEFLSELRKVEHELPEAVVGSASHLPQSRWDDSRNRAVRWMFSKFMAEPSAKLSRSPMFRQTYWDEAPSLITEVEPAAQARMIASAERARLPKAQIEELRLRAAAGSGELKIAEVDHLLKGRALDATQDLLYDAARKGQMSDALRIIMPFMEAQKEVMKVWAKVGTEAPQVARRAQQIVQGARGSGAFYTDPTTGEEMFTFPGSKFLTEHTIGMPIPLTGRVAGLNMFGSGIVPGMGPAVQIPARWIIPDKPQFDQLNKFLDPFGSTSAESRGIVEQMLPGWVTKLQTAWSAPESDRVFANTIKDVWSEGVSQGRYKTDTPEDVKDGLDHAKTNARWLYLIRGLSSVTGAPTTPSPEFMALDKDGKWHAAKVLSEDYRNMMDDPQIGPSGATEAFMAKYGPNAAAFMQGKSYATTPSAPSTVEYSAWARSDEGQKLDRKYGDVAGLFGPQGEGFDYNTYLRNIKTGATVTLTPEQFTQQTNNRVAQMIYYNQKDRFGPTPSKEQRAWLADLKVALQEKYPGYEIPLPGKPDQNTVKRQYIPAIEKAVADPALAKNDVARAAKVYLAARATAIESAKAAGYETFAQSKAAAPLRQWLRQVGDALSQRVPDFATMYDRVFDREMVSDDQVQTGIVAA